MNQSQDNILVVDDVPSNLQTLAAMLEIRGHTVRSASSGAQALEAIKQAAPDLILLDIMMPDMDGYAVCERLKANEYTSHIPVIFLSALREVKDKIKAFGVGGVDYITKPFHIKEVLTRIETHLSLAALQKQLHQEPLYMHWPYRRLSLRLDQLRRPHHASP